MAKKCLVLLSGGQDSTVALFLAMAGAYDEVHTLTIHYGQRHQAEVEAAAKIAQMAGVTSHSVVEIGQLFAGDSPLINPLKDVGNYLDERHLPEGVDPSFVPGRNILFLAIAGAHAFNKGARDIIIGVCETDFNGYPDCRGTFLSAMQNVLNTGILDGPDEAFMIHAPLLHKNKKETVELSLRLEGCNAAMAFSHTCYHGSYPPVPGDHACLLRAIGYRDAKAPDPLILRAKAEGLLSPGYPDSGYIPVDPE